MKKNLLLLTIALAAINLTQAQTVNILSVTTLPVPLTDTQHTKAVVSSEFSSGGCSVIGSLFSVMGDSVSIAINYSVGMLSVICDATDTFDLGVLSCAINKLHIEAFITGTAATDNYTLPMSISCLAAGITKSGNENKIAVFPNPASKELTVKMNGEKFSRSKISVLNLLGETIYSAIEISTGNSTVKRIDVSTLAKGIYFLKVETGTYTNVSRFLKN